MWARQRRMGLALALSLGAATGCACNEPSSPSATPTVTATSSPTPAKTATTDPTPGSPAPTGSATTSASAHVEGEPWLGAWESPPCGERKYPRWLTLEAGGKASGQERVSPCPPNVACVWSGIIPWQGTWKKADDGIELAVPTELANPKMMKPLPERLSWDASASALVEEASDPSCPYARRTP